MQFPVDDNSAPCYVWHAQSLSGGCGCGGSKLSRRWPGATQGSNVAPYVTLIGLASHHAHRLGSERATHWLDKITVKTVTS